MKMICIAGSGRTGSTLLSLLLSQHGEVFNIGQLRDIWRSYSKNLACSCDNPLQSCSFWGAAFTEFGDRKVKQTILSMQSMMDEFFRAAGELPDWSDQGALASLAVTHKPFLVQLARFITILGKHSGCNVLVDSSKSPEFSLACSLMPGIEIRVLNLVRDPRAVACSWERRKGRRDAIMFTKMWGDRQNKLSGWSRVIGDSCFILRYEDFCEDPGKSVQEIAEWADIKIADGVFDAVNHVNISWDRQHLYPPGNEKLLQEKKSGMDIVRSDTWKEPANHKLHRKVEQLLSSSMSMYNYQPGDFSDNSLHNSPGHDLPQTGTGTLTQNTTSNLNYIFLICSERSGSNLISQIMNCHPEIYSPPPYHLARDVGLNLHTTLGADQKPWEQLVSHLTARIERLNSPAAARQFSDWINASDYAGFGEIMKYVYAGIADSAGVKTVFIKENNLHKMLFFILCYFPEAKFVFQVRDPRDYMVSAKERKSGWMGNKFGSNLHAMEIWREDQLGGLCAMAHLGPSRVFFQRYEDLVSEPETVLTSLCRFLGIDFEPAMLEFHKTDDAVNLSKTAGARENLSKPLMSKNFGKFRSRLGKAEILMIETYLGDLIRRFGYELEYPDEKPSLNDIFTPQLYEVLERYINNENTPFYSDGFSQTGNTTPLQPDYKKDPN